MVSSFDIARQLSPHHLGHAKAHNGEVPSSAQTSETTSASRAKSAAQWMGRVSEHAADLVGLAMSALGDARAKVKAYGHLPAPVRGSYRWGRLVGAVALTSAIAFSVSQCNFDEAAPTSLTAQNQTLTELLDEALRERGLEELELGQLYRKEFEKRNLLAAMQDIAAIRGRCPDRLSSHACARKIHDIDPFLSIVTLVEDLPTAPYFPSVGRDRDKVNLPGGYSVALRMENRGAARTYAELRVAGFGHLDAALLMQGKPKAQIEAMKVSRETSLALVRLVKDDFELIARSRVNDQAHRDAFQSLTREQQAGLIYAAWNTGTVYKDAARTVRKLAVVQKDLGEQLRQGPQDGVAPQDSAAYADLVGRAASLISDIKAQITPSFRVARQGRSEKFVKNHRVGGYIQAWMAGKGADVTANASVYETTAQPVKYRLEPEDAKAALLRKYERAGSEVGLPNPSRMHSGMQNKYQERISLIQRDESLNDRPKPG